MQFVEQVLIGAFLGAVFGLYGYATKADSGEPLNYRKIGRTIFVYAAAGALVASSGDRVTEGRVEMATATTAIMGEIFDKLWSKARRALRECDDGQPRE